MKIENLSATEVNTFDATRLKQVETDIRKEQNLLKMEVYGNRLEVAKNKSILKRNLARVLTIKNQMRARKA